MCFKNRVCKIICLILILFLFINSNVFARISYNDATSYTDSSLYITGGNGKIIYDLYHNQIESNISNLSVTYSDNGEDNSPTYYIDVFNDVSLIVNSDLTINGIYTSIYSNCNVVFRSNNSYDVRITADNIYRFPNGAQIDSVYLYNTSSPCNLYINCAYIWSFYDDGSSKFKENVNIGGLYINKGNLDLKNNGAFLGKHSLSRTFINLINGSISSSNSYIECYLADGDYVKKNFIFRDAKNGIYTLGNIYLNNSRLRMNSELDDKNGLTRPINPEPDLPNYYNPVRVYCSGFIAENGSEIEGYDPGFAEGVFLYSTSSVSISNSTIDINGYLKVFTAREITFDNNVFSITSFLTCFDAYEKIKLVFKQDDSKQFAEVIGDNSVITGQHSSISPSIIVPNSNLELAIDGISDDYILQYSYQYGDGITFSDYTPGVDTAGFRTINFVKTKEENEPTLFLNIDNNTVKYVNGNKPVEGKDIPGLEISYLEDEGFKINITEDITVNIDSATSFSSNVINCLYSKLKITGNKKLIINYHYRTSSKDQLIPIFNAILMSNNNPIKKGEDNMPGVELTFDGTSYNNPLNIELNIYNESDDTNKKIPASLVSFDQRFIVPSSKDPAKSLLNFNNTVVYSNCNEFLKLSYVDLNVSNSKFYLTPIVFDDISEFNVIETLQDSNQNYINSTIDITVPEGVLKDCDGMYYGLFSQGNILIKDCRKNSDDDINKINLVNIPLPILAIKGVTIENSDINLAGYNGNILSQEKITIKLEDDNIMYLSSKNDNSEPYFDGSGSFRLPCLYCINGQYDLSSNINDAYVSLNYDVVDFETTDKFNIDNINKYHTIYFGSIEDKPDPEDDPDKPKHHKDHGSSYSIPETGIY